MSEIIVGYDGSDCAKTAVDQAIGLAKELGDKVVVVFGYAPRGYGGGEVPTHREAVKELGEKEPRRPLRRSPPPASSTRSCWFRRKGRKP